MSNNFYTVYEHTCFINNKKYIGITKQPIQRRWRNEGKGYKNAPYFYPAIQKYGWDNFKHEVLFVRLTKKEAEEIEIELIAYHKSNQKKFGYNIQNGGNTSGTHSEETKRKLSIINKGKCAGKKNYFYGKRYCKEQNYWYGKKLPQEIREKISRAKKGKKAWNSGKKNCFSLETRKKMSESQKAFRQKHPEFKKNTTTCKKCICLETKEIFDSLSDASKKMHLHLSHISACCRKKTNHTQGYHFLFLKDYNPEKKYNLKITHKNQKRVICLETGEIFDSLSECSKKLNINQQSLSMVCNKKYKTTGGLHFEFYTEREGDND